MNTKFSNKKINYQKVLMVLILTKNRITAA